MCERLIIRPETSLQAVRLHPGTEYDVSKMPKSYSDVIGILAHKAVSSPGGVILIGASDMWRDVLRETQLDKVIHCRCATEGTT